MRLQVTFTINRRYLAQAASSLIEEDVASPTKREILERVRRDLYQYGYAGSADPDSEEPPAAAAVALADELFPEVPL
jgi:hypothetical protein